MGPALLLAVKRHFIHALVLTFCMLPLQCATLERLSLDDMISKSTGIVRGKVMSTSAAFAPSQPVIYTHYTIQVSERFKGTGGNSVDVVVPGQPQVAAARAAPGGLALGGRSSGRAADAERADRGHARAEQAGGAQEVAAAQLRGAQLAVVDRQVDGGFERLVRVVMAVLMIVRVVVRHARDSQAGTGLDERCLVAPRLPRPAAR